MGLFPRDIKEVFLNRTLNDKGIEELRGILESTLREGTDLETYLKVQVEEVNSKDLTEGVDTSFEIEPSHTKDGRPRTFSFEADCWDTAFIDGYEDFLDTPLNGYFENFTGSNGVFYYILTVEHSGETYNAVYQIEETKKVKVLMEESEVGEIVDFENVGYIYAIEKCD